MSRDVQLWPVALGWIIVSLLWLLGWRRQALIAAAGLAAVSFVVFRAWFGF